MAVFTKGVIATDKKDVLEMAALAESALSALIRERRRSAFPDDVFPSAESRAQFEMPTLRLRPSMGGLDIDFTCDGEHRSLTVNFTCDGDHKAVAPKSISLMMGCSGNSELYVKTVLDSLSVYGPAYFVACDISDTPMALLETPRATLLGLLATGRLSGYDFERMIDKAPSRATTAYEEFVGCNHAEANQHHGIKAPGDRWDAMKQFAIARTQEQHIDEETSQPARARRSRP